MPDKRYTDFHRARLGAHLYPTEFLVRTMLGSYPRLKLEKKYEGKRLLDLGFGDGRNFLLFQNIGVKLYGVEPDAEVCKLVAERAQGFGIDAELVAGNNSSIPFGDAFFDYVVASHSIYYIAENQTFDHNVQEVARVLRPGGWLIATFPDLENTVLRNADALGDGHYRLTSDPFGLRNGTVFRAFKSEADIKTAFAEAFDDFAIGTFRDDWYGLLVSGYCAVCRRI